MICKMFKKIRFAGDWAELNQNFVFSHNPGQNIRNKIEKSSKTRQDEKSLISTFACFLTDIAES